MLESGEKQARLEEGRDRQAKLRERGEMRARESRE